MAAVCTQVDEHLKPCLGTTQLPDTLLVTSTSYQAATYSHRSVVQVIRSRRQVHSGSNRRCCRQRRGLLWRRPTDLRPSPPIQEVHTARKFAWIQAVSRAVVPSMLQPAVVLHSPGAEPSNLSGVLLQGMGSARVHKTRYGFRASLTQHSRFLVTDASIGRSSSGRPQPPPALPNGAYSGRRLRGLSINNHGAWADP